MYSASFFLTRMQFYIPYLEKFYIPYLEKPLYIKIFFKSAGL